MWLLALVILLGVSGVGATQTSRVLSVQSSGPQNVGSPRDFPLVPMGPYWFLGSRLSSPNRAEIHRYAFNGTYLGKAADIPSTGLVLSGAYSKTLPVMCFLASGAVTCYAYDDETGSLSGPNYVPTSVGSISKITIIGSYLYAMSSSAYEVYTFTLNSTAGSTGPIGTMSFEDPMWSSCSYPDPVYTSYVSVSQFPRSFQAYGNDLVWADLGSIWIAVTTMSGPNVTSCAFRGNGGFTEEYAISGTNPSGIAVGPDRIFVAQRDAASRVYALNRTTLAVIEASDWYNNTGNFAIATSDGLSLFLLNYIDGLVTQYVQSNLLEPVIVATNITRGVALRSLSESHSSNAIVVLNTFGGDTQYSLKVLRLNISCSPGTYPATETGEEACISCPMDSISNGSYPCTACPSGSIPLDGSDCMPCPMSYYANAELGECEICAVGTFSNATGLTACYACAYDKVATTEGSSSCSLCDIGTFRATATACSDCLPGRYGPTTGLVDTCLPCNPGRFVADGGASICGQCLPGTFANTTGLATCFECSETTVALEPEALACEPCPEGFDRANSTACVLSEPEPEPEPEPTPETPEEGSKGGGTGVNLVALGASLGALGAVLIVAVLWRAWKIWSYKKSLKGIAWTTTDEDGEEMSFMM